MNDPPRPPERTASDPSSYGFDVRVVWRPAAKRSLPEITGRCTGAIDRPSVTAWFGASGSGKTTLLKAMAGLIRPDSGRIHFGEAIWFDAEKKIHQPPWRRRIAFSFQTDTLVNHLTVAGNLRMVRSRKPEGDDSRFGGNRLEEMSHRFGIDAWMDRMPNELSGGQRQLVSLVRTLSQDARMILMDEPLSSLDAIARSRVADLLRETIDSLSVPVWIVTHDRDEVRRLATDVNILSDGKVIQHGPVADVFASPSSVEAAELVGVESLLRGTVVGTSDGMAEVDCGDFRLHAVTPTCFQVTIGAQVVLGIRGEDVVLVDDAGIGGNEISSVQNRLTLSIASVTDLGSTVRIRLGHHQPVVAVVTRRAMQRVGYEAGQTTTAWIKASAIHLMKRHAEVAK